MTEKEEPESITKGNGPAPSIHALTSTTSPVSMRTILTARTDGRPIAGWESAHFEGSICRDGPTTVDPAVFWRVVAAKEDPPPVLVPTTRIADAIKNERNTTSVCPVNVPGVLSYQDHNRHLTDWRTGAPPTLNADGGVLWSHQVKVFDVAPGQHSIQLKQGLMTQSRLLTFVAESGETLEFAYSRPLTVVGFTGLHPATSAESQKMQSLTVPPPTPRNVCLPDSSQ